MQAIHNIKTFSAIAALALSASMPFASDASEYVRDLSEANNESQGATGIQSRDLTKQSTTVAQAPDGFERNATAPTAR